jgi:hypothetical protein
MKYTECTCTNDDGNDWQFTCIICQAITSKHYGDGKTDNNGASTCCIIPLCSELCLNIFILQEITND